jgi:hypothetical protein
MGKDGTKACFVLLIEDDLRFHDDGIAARCPVVNGPDARVRIRVNAISDNPGLSPNHGGCLTNLVRQKGDDRTNPAVGPRMRPNRAVN